MMKRARLPDPIRVRMQLAELAFPKRHPSFDGKMQITRCGEQMQMVRHQNIIPDQPRIRPTPDIREQTMRLITREPRHAIFCASGDEDNRWLIEINMNALHRFVACLVGRGSCRAIPCRTIPLPPKLRRSVALPLVSS